MPGLRCDEARPTGDPTDFFPSERCGDCPPWTCEDCGQTCSAAALCGCWVRLDGLPLADVKALFAADGTFNINPEVTR